MSKKIYKVAHIREQGKDVIIIPISNINNDLTNEKLNEIRRIFQTHAIKTKLSGDVCLVWEFNNKLCALAPPQWKTFCASLNMRIVKQYINKELTIN
jgi:hypothetical protein